MITGCNNCFYLTDCGGREGNLDLFGCHLYSQDECAKKQWTCPWCRKREFIRRMVSVGGWPPPRPATIHGLSHDLPSYVPKLEHAYKLAGRIKIPIVALPTEMVVNGRGNRFGVKFNSATALRSAFHLQKDTHVLLVSVTTDQYLERFWQHHRENEIPAQLADLGIVGITVPNFSYFSDAPRPHTIQSQGRISRCIERLSQAGVAVVPHLNALTSADWQYWTSALQPFQDVKHVCKEFQTHDGRDDLEQLARVQDKLKRPLHPVLVGAGQVAGQLRQWFSTFTLVSSTPWFRAVKGRERALLEGDRLRWLPAKVGAGHTLRKLIEQNMLVYTRYMDMRASGKTPAQLDFLDVFERAVRAQARAAEQRPATLWTLSEPAPELEMTDELANGKHP